MDKKDAKEELQKYYNEFVGGDKRRIQILHGDDHLFFEKGEGPDTSPTRILMTTGLYNPALFFAIFTCYIQPIVGITEDTEGGVMMIEEQNSRIITTRIRAEENTPVTFSFRQVLDCESVDQFVEMANDAKKKPIQVSKEGIRQRFLYDGYNYDVSCGDRYCGQPVKVFMNPYYMLRDSCVKREEYTTRLLRGGTFLTGQAVDILNTLWNDVLVNRNTVRLLFTNDLAVNHVVCHIGRMPNFFAVQEEFRKDPAVKHPFSLL